MKTGAKKAAAKAADLDVRMAGIEFGLLFGWGNAPALRKRLAALKKEKAALSSPKVERGKK